MCWTSELPLFYAFEKVLAIASLDFREVVGQNEISVLFFEDIDQRGSLLDRFKKVFRCVLSFGHLSMMPFIVSV